MLLDLILSTFNVAEIRSICLGFNLRLYNRRNNFFEIRKEKLEKITLNRLFYLIISLFRILIINTYRAFIYKISR
jgi:abortive infection bacteriophage resistance protein